MFHCPSSTNRLELRRTERPVAVQRGVPGADEQRIAFPERDVEHAGQQLHHLAARLRAAGFEEAQMTRRDAGLGRQRQLALVPAVTPLFQQPSERGRRAALGESKQGIHRVS